jgi:hypothetical protein
MDDCTPSKIVRSEAPRLLAMLWRVEAGRDEVSEELGTGWLLVLKARAHSFLISTTA